MENKKLTIGLRTEAGIKNKRKAVAQLFIAKTECSEREFLKAISDDHCDAGDLSGKERSAIEIAKADFNKHIQTKLGISSALRIKTTNRDRFKLKIYINPKYL